MSQAENQLTPEGWSNTNIGDFAPLQRGFDLPNRDRIDGNYPVVYSNGVMNSHNTYQVKGPGVITGRSGTIGKVHYVNENYWPHNTALWVKQFNNAIPKYVYYLYTYIGFDRFSSGSGVPTLNRNDAHSFEITVPIKKEEQTAIANALSDVDALLTELENLIAKKQAIKTATMQQLLTGKTRLPQFATYTEGAVEGNSKGTKPSELGEIPEDWDIRCLGYLLEDNRIPSGLYKDKNLYGTGTAIIKLGDVFKNDSFNPDIVQRVKTTNAENKGYSVKIGDLIIALASVKLEGVGKVMIVKELSEPTVYDHNVALIRFKKNCNSNFMSFLFKSNYIRSLVASRATQVGTTFLKTSTILEFPILLPSPEEQTAIATTLSDMDNEILTLEQRLTKTRQIKQGMMQQLLTGRTRLPY